MRARAVLIVALLFSVSIVASVAASTPVASPAPDPKGCEGLGVYRVAMLSAGRDYGKARDRDGIAYGRDQFTYSSDEWLTLAEHALSYQRALKAITPPQWAEGWHQAQVEAIGLLEQVSRVAADEGVLAFLAFEDQIAAADTNRQTALASTVAACPDFPSFQRDWDALDGVVEGTPVATPSV